MTVQATFAAGTHRPAAPVLSFSLSGLPSIGRHPIAIVIDELQVSTPEVLADLLGQLAECIAADHVALHSIGP